MLKPTDCFIYKTMRCDDDGHSKFAVVAIVGDASYLRNEWVLSDEAVAIKDILRHGVEFDESEYTKLSDK